MQNHQVNGDMSGGGELTTRQVARLYHIPDNPNDVPGSFCELGRRQEFEQNNLNSYATGARPRQDIR